MSTAAAAELFRERFGEQPAIITFAPGRVNLIGEHTDYSGGYVFPVAIGLRLYVAASLCTGPSEMVSREFPEGIGFDLNSVSPATFPKEERSGWTRFPAGMGWALRSVGYEAGNLKAAVASEVPLESGISSSAAIEMAFGVAWQALHGYEMNPKALAKLGQKCENEFVGVKSGIMDQTASACGKEGFAMFFDTRDGHLVHEPLPPQTHIAVLPTGVRRELTASKYNHRRIACEIASAALGVPMLRDASVEDLNKNRYQIGQFLGEMISPSVRFYSALQASEFAEVIYRRARHVLTENGRCEDFRVALRANDPQRIGELMRQSHDSLRTDYEVTITELDLLAEAAREAPGCLGARMTGAGFGGACVALVRSDALEDFTAHATNTYNSNTGRQLCPLICTSSDGAGLAEG